MKDNILKPSERTLGEFLKKHYPDFSIVFGEASLEMDISNGLEVEYTGRSTYHPFEALEVHPYIPFTDGTYRPCYFSGSEYYLVLKR